ncbi:cell division protein FtsQ/DivIB [Granulicella arctica]|uniref:Cell division protein FtsQ n=1 Tax=Granulicella arctica TaxID=940613 RepID=A0A7Y9PL95_9BACT|nr:FtsQ-type POTRA domain-containing protein [Granulicella arctica]NYF81186.1 cell division protein FtsQ [Granulicella arctica]
MSKRGTAMLDEPEQEYAPSSDRLSSPRRSSARVNTKLRRTAADEFAEEYGDFGEERQQSGARLRQTGLKFRIRARVPKSLAGRIVTGVALLAIAGVGVSLLMLTRSFLLHDERFMIQSPSAIEIQGNQHLTRADLLGIFGEDIGRNIFRISLTDRQAELEQLPWVQHATVMRLLPGRIRVSIAERTPVAFVRQGSEIGLVDASGVLLGMGGGANTENDSRYSFPVVTGLSVADAASTREARMKIFERFTGDLDSSGEKISEKLSEVDLSNPEDVKALIPEQPSGILVHFGDDHFLDRYRKFQDHLAEWQKQYPNLASVDMRYEREVVLDMANAAAAAKASVDAKTAAAKPVAASSLPKPVPAAHVVAAHSDAKSVVKHDAKGKDRPVVKPALRKVPVVAAKPPVHAAPIVHKPAPKVAATAVPHSTANTSPVAPKPAVTNASAAARSGYMAKPSAGKPLLPTDTYQPPQVAPR